MPTFWRSTMLHAAYHQDHVVEGACKSERLSSREVFSIVAVEARESVLDRSWKEIIVEGCANWRPSLEVPSGLPVVKRPDRVKNHWCTCNLHIKQDMPTGHILGGVCITVSRILPRIFFFA
ncbi:unnamed protein product [Urochloa humidicola]